MDLVFRTVFVFLLIFVVTRAVGRRELSSMEPFDMILLVVIGDLVQQGVTQSDYSLTGATTVISTIALLTVFTAWLSYRVRRLRPVLEGEPVVLVVVFLHGVSGSRATYGWLPEQITDGRRIVRLDLRGHGRSAHAPGTYL